MKKKISIINNDRNEDAQEIQKQYIFCDSINKKSLFIKNFIKSFIPKKYKTYFKKFRKFNALNDLDKKMLKYINYNNGFYIECGANDGVDQSNTWYFEKYKNWNGILIEPIPRIFSELKKNRDIKNIFINKCLCTDTYEKKFINILDEDMLSKINEIKGTPLPASTLTNVLNDCNAPKFIDFFSLDVEGSEFDVFEGTDFKKYIFKYLLVESKNFDALNSYLTPKNYSFTEQLSNGDWLFKYKD
jgi:FkbM family methyltransferase